MAGGGPAAAEAAGDAPDTSRIGAPTAPAVAAGGVTAWRSAVAAGANDLFSLSANSFVLEEVCAL
jgi:hypothetical protein